jgi:hypothetical protein
MGIFWKTHFIYPPEVRGQVLACSVIGRKTTMPKYQNFPFGSTGKLNRSCQYPHSVKISEIKSIFKPFNDHG